MMNTAIHTAIEPLIRRNIFTTEEEAVRKIVRAYVLQQIAAIQKEISQFEKKYGMQFEEFCGYLSQRSELLVSTDLSESQRQSLSRSVMQEEDDWLDWKASQEMLDRWLGISGEVDA